MSWKSTKTYSHVEGLSCAFRQWRATSHCNLIHGYALSFRFEFAAHELDARNWCADFGDLKELKKWLHHMFDHTLCVAKDDPELAFFELLANKKLADLRVVAAVGCEKFAELAYYTAQDMIKGKYGGRVHVSQVEVKEHEGNSAIYSL